MKKKIIGIFTMCILIAIISIAGIAYAKYKTSLIGNATAEIAKWSFKVNGQTDENFTIDLATTRTGIEQEANVQEGFVGPGTAGAFEIEIDARDTEVSLVYDINMDVDDGNNEKLPKNLIFYSDAEMKNAIYHTDNFINLNGFIAHDDDNKVKKQTIYWKWDYETGQTQEEKDSNDIADSLWMGKSVSLSIGVIGKQANESPASNQYAVTFDANGGTLQGYGNATQATKLVNYGEEYGELPVPTREGYTFNGWNTKNLIDEESVLMAVNGAKYIDGHYVCTFVELYRKYGDATTGLPISDIKENRQYTITMSGYVDYLETTYAGLLLKVKYMNGEYVYSDNINGNEKTVKFTTESNKTISSIEMGYGTGSNRRAYISHLKIEEGAISSLPVTSEKIVDISENKILYAEWIKNNN